MMKINVDCFPEQKAEMNLQVIIGFYLPRISHLTRPFVEFGNSDDVSSLRKLIFRDG